MSIWRRICYAAPFVGVGGLQFLTMMYLMKYATDVLLIAPAAMGAIFGLGRVWDAMSDPLVGHLSDGTRSRWGRRRPWVVAAVLPLALAALAMWVPPALSGGALVTWMAVAVLAYFTANTAFGVPHESWGTELSTDRHERTNIYAFRHVAYLLGMFGGVALVSVIVGSAVPRQAALVAVLVLIALSLIGVSLAARFVPNGRSEAPRRVNAFAAMRVVWRNPHARRLLIVQFIERLGTASLSALGAYVAHYLVGDESVLPLLLVFFAVPALLFVPVATRLARRFDKRAVWMASMALSAVGFGSLYFVGRGDTAWLCGCAAIAGIGDTCGSVVGSSMLGDVIDHDELETGERREGIYFALWGFAHKSAYGAALLVTGVALQLAGYVPGQPQSTATETLLRLQMSLVPLAGYLAGLLVMRGYQFGEAQHKAVLEQLHSARALALPAADS
jgi:GPH family glycoside/pentoside/hexuronide:cation symporter